MRVEYYGYAGRILEVDLSSGNIRKTPLDLELARTFIGGCGLDYRLVHDLIEHGGDPLSAEAPILFSAGPLVGTLAPGAGKITGTLKFPLAADRHNKHYIGSARAGSRHFGLMLKNAGYDHVIITGRARTPVYLKIIDDNVEICDAGDLWGKKDIYETTDELTNRHGRCGVIAIGAAGENLVKFSMSMVDSRSTLGKNGLGASMGSKNLKAIAVYGTKGVRVRDAKRFMITVDEVRRQITQSPFYKPFHSLGIHAGWDTLKVNMNSGRWTSAQWEANYGPDTCRLATKDVHACSACMLGCRTSFEIRDGAFAGQRCQTGHFIHLATLGQALNTPDWRIAAKLQDTCNRAGLCVSAFATTASSLTSLFERGTLSLKATDGLEISRSYASWARLADMIIHRQGFGDTVAEGWFSLSQKIDVDLTRVLGLIKGANGVVDPRVTRVGPNTVDALVNPRGADIAQTHWATSRPGQSIEALKVEAQGLGIEQRTSDRIFSATGFDAGRLTPHVQDLGVVMDCLGLCAYYGPYFGLPLNMITMAELYSAATGIEVGPKELKQRGERVFNLIKLLNVKEGFNRQDDSVPESWFRPKKTANGVEELTDYFHRQVLTARDLELMLNRYYEERGWDVEEGVPSKEKLTELGLVGFEDHT